MRKKVGLFAFCTRRINWEKGEKGKKNEMNIWDREMKWGLKQDAGFGKLGEVDEKLGG